MFLIYFPALLIVIDRNSKIKPQSYEVAVYRSLVYAKFRRQFPGGVTGWVINFFIMDPLLDTESLFYFLLKCFVT